MDLDRFDALAQHIGAAPRRAFLHGALGSGLAAMLTRAGSQDGAARKKRKKKCRGGSRKRCGGRRVNLATNPANCGACGFVCESGACVNGACTCDAGQSQCLSGCACADRVGDGKVCFKGGNNGIDCDSDDDCPFRSLCFSINKCSVPCVA